MNMGISKKNNLNYTISSSHTKKYYESFYEKKQKDLLTIRSLEIAAENAKSSKTSEEESISLSNNKTMLKSLLEIAGATPASVYTEDSIRDLAECMSRAASVSTSKNAKASDVYKALSHLRSGLSKLRVAEKRDKKGNSGEMLESDIILTNGAVTAAQDAKYAAKYGNITGTTVNVATTSISVSAVITPKIDISL